MSATLTISSTALAFGDSSVNSNPSLRFFDWKRLLSGVQVNNPEARNFPILAGEEKTIIDGSRTTLIDGTTTFSLSISTLASDRYRLARTSGTTPGFRTARALTLSGAAVALVSNSNGTLTMLCATNPFGAVVVGDSLKITGVTTGDVAGGFNTLNEGLWTVLSSAVGALTLARPSGEDYSGYSETITLTSESVKVFSAAGVQVGDTMDVVSGFAVNSRRTYTVLTVNATEIEFISTSPLATETGIAPGASGLLFYSSSKRWLRVESDQEVVVRVNGDTGNSNRLSPWVAGDASQVAEYTRTGPTWQLKVYNRSTATANVLVISVE